MRWTLGRALFFLAVTATFSVAAPATRPDPLGARVDQLLQRLDSDEFAEREAAAAELDQLPPEALPFLEVAMKRTGLSPDVRTSLTAPVARLRRVVVRQTSYQGNLAFFQSQLIGEYERVGQKDPKWDKPARAMLDEVAKLQAAELSHRHTGDSAYKAAEAVRKLKPADPVLRGLAMEYDDNTRPLKPAIDLWPKIQASGYSAFRKASMLRFIVQVAGNNQAPATKDKHDIKKFVTLAAELWADILRDDKFPPAVAIPHLVDLLTDSHNAGVDAKEAWEILDRRLSQVIGEEHIVRLNAKGSYLVNLSSDQRNNGGSGWEQSMRTLEDAEKVFQRAYDLFPNDRHAPTTMIEVTRMIPRGGTDQTELWFERAIKADPENYTAWENRLMTLDGEDPEYLGLARQALASGSFETRIPLFVVEAHEQLLSVEPPAWASLVPKPYYGRHDVWTDISTAYEGFLRAHPDAVDDREAYLELAYYGGHWSTAAEQLKVLSQRPDWSKRNEGLVRMIGLEVPMRLADPKERPDYRAHAIKRDREDHASMKSAMVDAYEVVGRKNAKWDEPARQTLAALAIMWSNSPDRKWDETNTILKFGRSAIDSGCDDPLVRTAYAWVNDMYVTPRKPTIKLATPAELKALLASDYSEWVKLSAVAQAIVGRLVVDPNVDKTAKDDCMKQLEDAIALLPAVVTEKQTRPEYVSHLAGLLLYLANRADGDLKAFHDRLHAALEQAKLDPFAMQEVKGWYLWQVATRALPDREGKKGTPKDDAYDDYRKLAAEAATFAESLWKQQPTRLEPLDMLLQIASLDGDGDRMRFWLRQSALIDPDSRYPGQMALAWTQWAQHFEDEARAAGATDAYYTQLPFMLVEFHVKSASEPEEGKPTPDLPDVELISAEDTWVEMATIFEAHLGKYPDDSDTRSEYTSLACRAGRWTTAIEQFKLLGDRVRPRAFVTAERLEACKRKAAALEKIANQSPQPEAP